MRHVDRLRAAAERRRQILEMLASGLSRLEVAERLGVSKQRLSVILGHVPAAEIEAAVATGAGKVRCPCCGSWVLPPRVGSPRR